MGKRKLSNKKKEIKAPLFKKKVRPFAQKGKTLSVSDISGWICMRIDYPFVLGMWIL